MPYFDVDEPQVTPENEAEARRKVLGMIAGSGKKPVLGSPNDQPGVTTYQPGSRAYDLAVGATTQPNPPTPKMAPTQPPNFSAPPFPKAPVLGGTPSQPVKPNVAPQRSDFEAKPELGGWKKYLGLGLAALAGPQAAGPLAEKILHGQRDRADTQYGQAEQEWQGGQADQMRQAQIRNIDSEIQARTNKPDKPEGLTQQEAQAVEELVAKGMPRVDAIGQVKAAGQKPPNATFEEQSYAEWLKTHPGGTRMQFTKEAGAAKQPPEREPRQLMEVEQPDGSIKVVEARPGTVLPKGAKKVGTADKGPTADEQRRADLGKNLNENMDAYEEIVRRRPDLFGPVAGRVTATKMMTGSSDPDISALRAIKEFAGMAAVGTHAMRNAQHVKIASDAMMNLYDQPEAILAEKGPLSRARTSIQTFIGDVEGQRVQDKGALHNFTYNGQQYENVPDALYRKYKGKPGFKE